MKTFYLLLFSMVSLCADYETIVVELNEDHPLLPVYIAQFKNDTKTLSSKYLEELHKILLFDFNHNGMTQVVPSKEEEVYYVLAINVDHDQLTCQVESIVNRTIKKTAPLTLSGELNHDRKEIHKLADAIHKTLFNSPGVASTSFLYTRKTKEGSELIQADYDGHNRHVLKSQVDLFVTPCYVPAGIGKKSSSCLVISYDSGQPKLFISSIDPFHPLRLTPLKGNQLTPAMSRQRDKIAFVSDAKGNPDLYLIELEENGTPKGDPRRIYGFPKATQSSPTFNPEGNKIAFVSNKDGATRIYMMPIPDPEAKIKDIRPQLITTRNRESSAPAWSPDGTKLAYCSKNAQGIRQIWVYDFKKNEERQLTTGAGDKENPAWGPNSIHLLFNTRENGATKLFMLNLHQPKVFELSQESGENRFPSWG
ncbi:hypothetical protein N9Y92_03650 [Chlamydiales bacterium]|nr:hypothetical protein [Chlamydiales bacterium]